MHANIIKNSYNMKTKVEESNNLVTPIYIILGSGGHTAEMCNITKALLQYTAHPEYYSRRKVLIAKTDSTSKSRYESTLHELNGKDFNQNIYLEIPRSREVGQFWLSTILTSFYALLWSIWLIFKDRPHLILCNGPGTCVPICIAAYFWRLLGRLSDQSKIVYVESFCRVKTLSLSGKILLRLVDVFVIQWPILAKKYAHWKNVQYFGNIM